MTCAIHHCTTITPHAHDGMSSTGMCWDNPAYCKCWESLAERTMKQLGGIACSGHEDFAAGTWTFHRAGACP